MAIVWSNLPVRIVLTTDEIASRVAINGNHLAWDWMSPIWNQEQDTHSDVIWIHESLDRLIDELLLGHLGYGLATCASPILKDVLEVGTVDGAGQYCVGTDACLAYLYRQCLSQTIEAPYCGRIWTAIRISNSPAERRHYNNSAGSRLLKIRNREACHIERSSQIDPKDGFPCIRLHRLHWSGRTRGTGIVYQHIQATEYVSGINDEPFDR